MKRSLIVVLILAGLLISVKQISAQHLPKISDLKNREIPLKRSNVKLGKDGKTKLDFSKTQKSNQMNHKAADMTYQEVTSLPFSNSSTLDEDSYFLEGVFFDGSYAEGYEITLTKGEIIEIFHKSDDFDCYLYVLDSNFNLIMENDDYNDDDYNSRIFFSVSYTGVHYIIAAGYDEEEIGDYTISIDKLQSLSSQAYYVDAINGDDFNTGQAPTDAKQSIHSVLETLTNGIIYIMSDVLVDSIIEIEDGLVVCLAPYNGGDYTIKRGEACIDEPMIGLWGSLLYLSNDTIAGTLTLDGGYSDTATNPIITDGMILYADLESVVFMYPSITFQNNYSNYIAPAVLNEGLMYMYGGTISNNTGETFNAVYNSGTFVMMDGNITDNYALEISGVCNLNTFIMHGGTISNNSAVNEISGMYNEREFSMYGGTISDNSAQYYSGVFNEYIALFYGGNINNNSAEYTSGVYNGEDGFMMIYGGTISNNTAETFSGILNDGYLNIWAGNIIENQADMAAGITNYDYIFIADGIIADNEAEIMSSGVINEEGAAILLSGGRIYGNVSSGYPNQGLTHIGLSCILSDSITIDSDNQIFLLEGSKIAVNGTLTSQTVGTIMPFKFDDNDEPDYAHQIGLQVLFGITEEGLLTDYGKFPVADDGDGNQWFIDPEGKLYTFLSVSNLTNNSALEIYPNPTINVLYLHLNNLALEQATMNIYDMYGKLVQQVEINDESQAIDVEHLSTGVYFLQLFDNGRMIDCQKIIKE